jgi:hypothetical protein
MAIALFGPVTATSAEDTNVGVSVMLPNDNYSVFGNIKYHIL